MTHLVGQEDARDGVSVGQRGFVVKVLFPMATAEEAGRVGDVKHHNAAQCAFIIDPVHGYETFLSWREDKEFMLFIHASLDPSVEPTILVPAMSHIWSVTLSLSDHSSSFTE